MNLTSRLRKSSVLAVMCCVLTIQALAAPLALAATNSSSVTPPSAPGPAPAQSPVTTTAAAQGGGGAGPSPVIAADESYSNERLG